MSTQYDDIGTRYNEMKKLPTALLEKGNIKAALAPHIKDASVLDLACGSGRNTDLLLELGTARILGVDISKTMVDAALQVSSGDNRATFKVADCSVPMRHDEGPFDIVLGSWFLNYASSREEMTKMYQNIAINLKETGHFIGITPVPSEDPRALVETVLAAKPPQHENIFVTLKGEVQDGVETHLVAMTKAGTVEFDQYHLRKSVYEEAAKAGGMVGTLSWRPLFIPGGEDRPQGLDESLYKSCLEYPHFSVLVIAKQ